VAPIIFIAAPTASPPIARPFASNRTCGRAPAHSAFGHATQAHSSQILKPGVTAVPTLPTRPWSSFGQTISDLPFTAADQKALSTFRNRLRRKAIWVVVTPSQRDFAEAVEVYRPYELPGNSGPSWIIWRSITGVLVLDRDDGPLGEPTSLTDALEIVEAILRTEMRKAIRAIPRAVGPKLPRRFCPDKGI
jgi:hypothetical protein